MTTFFVPGKPTQQGSMKHIGNGRVIHSKSAELKFWREAIGWRAKSTKIELLSNCAVEIHLRFILPRPKTITRAFPTVPPDLDKFIRAVLDALTGIAYKDDAQVCKITASKEYDDTPGVWITIDT